MPEFTPRYDVTKYSVTIFAAALAGLFVLAQPAHAEQRKLLRWTTSPVGSFGYTVATSLTKTIERALGGEYLVSVDPYPSTTIAMRTVMDGSGEIAYTADIGMTQFQQRVGGFNNYKSIKPEIAHTWYAYPMESMIATLASNAGRFKCWRDFSEQPVFYTNAGFMNWLNWQRTFSVLGYKLKHVQIDIKANTRTLQTGVIVGSAIYTTAGRSLADYWTETANRLDVRIVNPCPDEVAKLTAAGLTVVDVDPKPVFSKNVGPSMLQGVPILFGYNARLDIPEDLIYKLLAAFYNERDSLAKANPGFTPLAKDFIGMQVRGVNANPTMAVHPGLARFLKERNAWSETWKVGGSG